ncbi:MAG: hypothetical protein J0L89_08110 [Xanthomonadales bacterium]|nr:hypothetical protein [Xanthomonadales bacterium]
MIRKPSTAGWVARRAAELEDQAAALDAARSGGWRGWKRRQEVAGELRSQASALRVRAARSRVDSSADLPF